MYRGEELADNYVEEVFERLKEFEPKFAEVFYDVYGRESVLDCGQQGYTPKETVEIIINYGEMYTDEIDAEKNRQYHQDMKEELKDQLKSEQDVGSLER